MTADQALVGASEIYPGSLRGWISPLFGRRLRSPFGADVFSMIGYRWFEPPANLHTDPPGLFVFSARDGAALTRNVKRQSTCGAVQRHLVPAFPIVFGRRCNFDPKLPSANRRAIFQRRLAQMRNRSRSSLLRLCARAAVNQPAHRRVPARRRNRNRARRVARCNRASAPCP